MGSGKNYLVSMKMNFVAMPKLCPVSESSDAFMRKAASESLDPNKLTPHTMRHTAATEFSATKADVGAVQAFTGHKSVQMVMRYIHARDDRVDEAMDLMEERTEQEQESAAEQQVS